MKFTLFFTILIATQSFIILSASRFRDNGDGTIYDAGTRLIWQKCIAGTSGTNCSTGNEIGFNWESAINYCQSLSLGGRGDWRLPNINELVSIIDYNFVYPAINTSYFPTKPNVNNSLYSSTSSPTATTTSSMSIDFREGILSWAWKTGPSAAYVVRCVVGP